MACTVFGESTPEFKETEAKIVMTHPVMVQAKISAEACWADDRFTVDRAALVNQSSPMEPKK